MCHIYVYATFSNVFNVSQSLEIDEHNMHASLIAVCDIDIEDSCNSNSCRAITVCVLGHVHGQLWSCMYVYHKM